MDWLLVGAMVGLGVFLLWCAIDAHRHPGDWS